MAERGFAVWWMVCAGVLVAASVEARDLVVYRVVEELETKPYPLSRANDGALAEDLLAQTTEREREAVRDLGRIKGVQPISAITYGGGKNRYGYDDPEVFTKSLGEQRVQPEETGGVFRWAARQLGIGTSKDDSLPTFEEHLVGQARVESSFIAPKGKAPATFNGKPVTQSADRVAVVIHAEADGKSYQSRPIHLTVEELATLAKDPEAALESPVGGLIRSVYREDIVGLGREDHTGIEPVVAVQAVTKPGPPGALLGTLPESLLDRTKKHESLSPDEVRSQLYDRKRKQFYREHIAAVMKPTIDADNAARKAITDRLDPPPASGRGKPGTIQEKLFTATSPSGRQRDVYKVNDGKGGWDLVTTRPGQTPGTLNESYRPSAHGEPPATTATRKGGSGKVNELFD